MIPWPATSIEQMISWFSGVIGRLEGAAARRRARWGCLRRGCAARAGSAPSSARWISRWWANTTRRSPEEQKSWIQAERGVELAARGKQLQCVQPHEAFGAQRRRDARIELVQVQRLALQPRDEVALGQAVLGLVVELDRHDGTGLRR